LKPNNFKGDAKLMNLIRDAVSGAENDDGWARLSKSGVHISNQASFDSRNYCYSRLSGFIEVIGTFELRRNENKHSEIRKGKSKNVT
jgi:hypothetical protein